MTHPASCGVLMPESGADGAILVQHVGAQGEEFRHYLTGSGQFVVPPDVYLLSVELIGGGVEGGEDGAYVSDSLTVEPGVALSYSVGARAKFGDDADPTTFGPLTAAGGRGVPPSLASPSWLYPQT